MDIGGAEYVSVADEYIQNEEIIFISSNGRQESGDKDFGRGGVVKVLEAVGNID